jgi:hypothetical protein
VTKRARVVPRVHDGRVWMSPPRRLTETAPAVEAGWLPWTTTIVCLLGVALAAPEWLPHGWTREDGPVEYATFACFLVASALVLVVALRVRPARRPMLAAAALCVVLFAAAGEELSWGQRLLDVETPEALVDGNAQDELNLHNIEGLQDKAVIAQLGIAVGGVLLASLVREPWARIGLPCFAGYLAYRAARAVGAVVGWGAADRNSEAAELVLAVGLLGLAGGLVIHVGRALDRVT